MSTTTFFYIALTLAISPAPFADAFSRSNANSKPHLVVKYSSHRVSSTELKYRSLHHGPDVEPLSDKERQGADSTKMDKDQIEHYGPGDFAQDEDHHLSDFYGGDSEMGLSGDGNVGLQMFGRDVSPHRASTSTANIDQALVVAENMSYTDGLLQSNPGMDTVRAQQVKNRPSQKVIATSNKHSNEVTQCDQEYFVLDHEYGDDFEDPASFSSPVEVGEEVEGIITLRSPIYGVAVQEIMVKNQHMGHSSFRAGFVGDEYDEWSVTPNDGFLKKNEAAHFIVRFNPYSPGLSKCHLVIETEDFKKTWKVVGSTGEYDF